MHPSQEKDSSAPQLPHISVQRILSDLLQSTEKDRRDEATLQTLLKQHHSNPTPRREKALFSTEDTAIDALLPRHLFLPTSPIFLICSGESEESIPTVFQNAFVHRMDLDLPNRKRRTELFRTWLSPPSQTVQPSKASPGDADGSSDESSEETSAAAWKVREAKRNVSDFVFFCLSILSSASVLLFFTLPTTSHLEQTVREKE